MPNELELLQKIAENTGSNSALCTAIVAGGSAVAGALTSAYISYLGIKLTTKTEQKKLHASLVTSERLRWLQDLRIKVADFYTKIEMQLSHLERPVPSGGEKKLQEKLDSLSIKAALQCNHILLALNKNKEDQKKLHSALNDTLVFTRDCFSRKRSSPMQIDRELFSTLKQEAFDALEEIGQSVWEKVKYLE